MALLTTLGCLIPVAAQGEPPVVPGELLPTGVRITPTAAEGAIFQPLNPDLPSNSEFLAGQAVTTAVSPDGNTLLILTSGYNRTNDPTGRRIHEESNEYVFFTTSPGRYRSSARSCRCLTPSTASSGIRLGKSSTSPGV